jgi:heme/copper-type cytochrome/quinol oxidase subunit 2
MATSKTRRKQTHTAKKKVHFEAFWAMGIAGVLVWLWVVSYPWMPPVAFSTVNSLPQQKVQEVDITAGQWFWIMQRADEKPSEPGTKPGFAKDPYVRVVVGEPVKFVAESVDVNHGFGVFRQSDDSAILLQMQVVPKIQNVFYYTFKDPGAYFVRCLEYCGYAHPYMTSTIKAVPVSSSTSAQEEERKSS